jgi:hypothetical protein
MSVYFAQRGDLIKIGFSDNVPKRMREIGRVTLLATITGPRSLERALHQAFWLDHVEGEWFSDSKPLRTYIDGCTTLDTGWPDTSSFRCSCGRRPEHLAGAHPERVA